MASKENRFWRSRFGSEGSSNNTLFVWSGLAVVLKKAFGPVVAARVTVNLIGGTLVRSSRRFPLPTRGGMNGSEGTEHNMPPGPISGLYTHVGACFELTGELSSDRLSVCSLGPTHICRAGRVQEYLCISRRTIPRSSNASSNRLVRVTPFRTIGGILLASQQGVSAERFFQQVQTGDERAMKSVVASAVPRNGMAVSFGRFS